MLSTTTWPAFLRNNNKECLIEILSDTLSQANVYMKQAEADADSLIVSNVLFLTESRQPIVVGTDTYLLLMMIAQATEDMVLHILFCENPTTLYIESTVFKTYTNQYWKDQHISLGITCHYWV